MTALFLIFGFVAITLWGTLLGRRQRLIEYTSNRDRGTAFEVYCTTLSSLVGGWMFFGLNAVGYEAGLVGIAIGFGYCIGLALLIWLTPRIKAAMTSGGFDTLDEFVGLHFGRVAQTLITITNFAIFLSVLSAQFMAMTSYLRVVAPQFAGWLPIAAALAVVLYTSIGGYKGVAVTDIFKMLVLTLGVGAFALIVLSSTSSISWAQVPTKHWHFTGYGFVFLIGAVAFFPATILVRSDLWQRIIHAESPTAARKAMAWTIPSLLIFYTVLTLIGIASRGRLGADGPAESAGLLLLNHDVLSLPIPSLMAQFAVALISFGIFAALASTADNNLNIAAIGLSKLLFRRDWMRLHSLLTTDPTPFREQSETRLLMRCRLLCIAVGSASVGSALFLNDIVAIMVNAASIMMLFLPATIGALIFNHYSRYGGVASIITGIAMYFSVLAMGINLKSAFLPAFVAASVVYVAFIVLHHRRLASATLQGSLGLDTGER